MPNLSSIQPFLAIWLTWPFLAITHSLGGGPTCSDLGRTLTKVVDHDHIYLTNFRFGPKKLKMADLWPVRPSADLCFFHFLGGGPTCSDLAEILHKSSLGDELGGEFSSYGPKIKNGRVMAKNGQKWPKTLKLSI